jgi:protein gp37
MCWKPTDLAFLSKRREHQENMTTQSRIEWTEHTWNPVTGCSKLSPGCAFCYAGGFAKRLQAMGVAGYENGFAVTLQPERLHEPLKRPKPTVYFVNSMSDLFHDEVPDAYIEQVFGVITAAAQHRFQILTKRPERLTQFGTNRRLPRNAWLGVSVENRRHGVPRIDLLRAVDAHVRFLSVEPLLEDLGTIDLAGIHWVIVGGESGPRSRPMKGRMGARSAGPVFEKQGAFLLQAVGIRWRGWYSAI